MLSLISSFLTLPILLVSLVSGGYLWLKFLHEPAIRREYAAELSVQVAQERARLQEESQITLEAYHKTQQERQQAVTVIREGVARAPQSVSCVSSPAMRAALDGLRGASTGSPTPADPPKPPSVP